FADRSWPDFGEHMNLPASRSGSSLIQAEILRELTIVCDIGRQLPFEPWQLARFVEKDFECVSARKGPIDNHLALASRWAVDAIKMIFTLNHARSRRRTFPPGRGQKSNCAGKRLDIFDHHATVHRQPLDPAAVAASGRQQGKPET